MDTEDWVERSRTSYDAVADAYVELVTRGYPERDPQDRALLDLAGELASAVGGGPVADLGCGPGHVTGHLHARGVPVVGVDVSPRMVEIARAAHPGVRFDVGDMTRIDLEDGSLSGALLWYSLIHVPDAAAPGVIARVARALRPGGVLLLGFQVGDEVRAPSHAYGGIPVVLRSQRRPVDRVAGWVRAAGLTVELQAVRDPDGDPPEGRVLARRPG
ncbi:class I SAM-dependent methyltransferase [Cellulosimicrobium cellulans]|uniref:class I SAM-dependent methyltransferase n=1 Tax=Cellulosimicrobium cellulans TaxID=1710 RepID=UPI00130D828C|nr:class I SAM-dependent methyltransferase [Cellulosimicrobium cellulans]